MTFTELSALLLPHVFSVPRHFPLKLNGRKRISSPQRCVALKALRSLVASVVTMSSSKPHIWMMGKPHARSKSMRKPR